MNRALTFALIVALPLATGCSDRRRGGSGSTSAAITGVATTGTASGGTYSGPVLARVADHGDPLGEEQELVELVQRARKDPKAEAARLNARHGTALDFSGYAAQPPLSPNEFLGQAAGAHATDMATRGFYAHLNPEGVNANGRILATLYDLHALFGTSPTSNLTENIAKGTGVAPGNPFKTPQGVHDALMIDSGVVGAKHRQLLLGANGFARYREIGASFRHVGQSDYVVEEVAVTNTDRPFVLGVAYDDRDADGVCRDGEGRAAVPVSLSHASGFSISTATRTAGGFSFEVFVDGDYTLTIDGRSTLVTVGTRSVKVDLRSGQLAR